MLSATEPGLCAQLLPSVHILRIMREILPDNSKVSSEAKESVQRKVNEFILHLTAEAAIKCEREGRKSITGDDILWSIERLGFTGYQAPLRAFLQKYRAIESEDKLRKRASEGGCSMQGQGAMCRPGPPPSQAPHNERSSKGTVPSRSGCQSFPANMPSPTDVASALPYDTDASGWPYCNPAAAAMCSSPAIVPPQNFNFQQHGDRWCTGKQVPHVLAGVGCYGRAEQAGNHRQSIS